MGRENCVMFQILGSEMYCDYYDAFYMKCEDKKICPDGLDDEDEWDEYQGYEPE